MSRRHKHKYHIPTPHQHVMNQIDKQLVDERKKNLTTNFEIASRQNSWDFTTFLGSLPNPDPVLKKLGYDIQVYEDLRYDSRVSAVVTSRKSAVTSMEWRIKSNDQALTDFYTTLFKTYPMHSIISEMLDASLYGYKPFEIIWENINSQLIPVQFIGKPSRWFRYGEENELRFLSKGSGGWLGVPVPENKFIVARNEPSYDNPYGFPVLSGCFWPVSFRKSGLKYWTIFLEKYGMPFLLAKAPEGAKEAEINTVADLLTNMVQDAIAVVPQEYSVEIQEATEGKGAASSLHKTYIDFMNTEIAMAVVGTNLTTEVQGGSYAASQSHMEVRSDIIEADRQIVQEAFNELIKLTNTLNFKNAEVPTFELYQMEQVSETRSKRDKNLTDTGVKFSKAYYQKNYSLDEDDFEVTETPEGEEPDEGEEGEEGAEM